MQGRRNALGVGVGMSVYGCFPPKTNPSIYLYQLGSPHGFPIAQLPVFRLPANPVAVVSGHPAWHFPPAAASIETESSHQSGFCLCTTGRLVAELWGSHARPSSGKASWSKSRNSDRWRGRLLRAPACQCAVTAGEAYLAGDAFPLDTSLLACYPSRVHTHRESCLSLCCFRGFLVFISFSSFRG